MYWKDTRLTHNQTEVKKKEPLPITKSEHPGFPGSVNKSYVLLKVLGAIISQATITRFLKDPDDIKRLWKPDIFIDQAIQIRWGIRALVIKSSRCKFTFSLRTPKFDDAPQSVKVYEDSIVRFSKRVNFDIGCQMNFKMYPVDMQKCEVKFESFGYQTNVITINFTFSGKICITDIL